jgi:CMP-N,N'-diacetyllegionaminic acid synthase
MIFDNEFLAIIPARAGSKGIPEKNIQLIGNKPMIQFTFEAVLEIFNIENIVVSTNDTKVLEIAKENGLKIPFIRPEELSTDNSRTTDVIKHTLNWYFSKYKFFPKNFILLQPTSPFRDSNDINLALNQFKRSAKKTLISVADPIQHPADFIIKGENGNYKRLDIGEGAFGRQSYREVSFIDGGIYISNTESFMDSGSLIGNDPEIFKTTQIKSIDIDTPFDLQIARALYSFKH